METTYMSVNRWHSGKEPASNVGETQGMHFQFLGQEDPLGRNGNPLQYFCLENSMDREAWKDSVHEGVKSQTQLSTVQ